MTKIKMFKRFDTSHSFWKRFDAKKPNRQKKLGLYEVENIDKPCYVTLAVNPKEYFEFFKDYTSNKKHKEIKKGAKGMDFENYTGRIKSLKNFETFEHPKNKYKEVMRFVVKNGDMLTTKIAKGKFLQSNDKRSCFQVVYFLYPLDNCLYKKLTNLKRKKDKK